jgi:hypothetical protein
MEEVADAAHSLGSMPLLAQDSHQLALGYGRRCDMFHHIVREGLVEIIKLAFFTIVDAMGMILAYPLAPTVQNQFAILAHFLAGEFGIADEEDMDGEAHVYQGLR